MASFDEMDARAAAVMTRHLGKDGVDWLPQAQRARQVTDGRYTSGSEIADPARPVKLDIKAIVTWRSQMIGAGATDPQTGLNRGQVEDFDCVVDIEVALFMVAGVLQAPIEGDIFRLPGDYQGNDLVQVMRDADDGSARLIYYCRLPA